MKLTRKFACGRVGMHDIVYTQLIGLHNIYTVRILSHCCFHLDYCSYLTVTIYAFDVQCLLKLRKERHIVVNIGAVYNIVWAL